jgi:hypothetical protein
MDAAACMMVPGSPDERRCVGWLLLMTAAASHADAKHHKDASSAAAWLQVAYPRQRIAAMDCGSVEGTQPLLITCYSLSRAILWCLTGPVSCINCWYDAASWAAWRRAAHLYLPCCSGAAKGARGADTDAGAAAGAGAAVGTGVAGCAAACACAAAGAGAAAGVGAGLGLLTAGSVAGSAAASASSAVQHEVG